MKRHADGTIYLTVHVDYILLIISTKQAREIFEISLEEQFEITKQINDLSYLGMTIQKMAEGIKVHQSGYIETMMTKFGADLNNRRHVLTNC